MNDRKEKETGNMHPTRVRFNEINENFSKMMEEYTTFQQEYTNFMYSSIKTGDPIPTEPDIFVRGIELISKMESSIMELVELGEDPEVEFEPGERNIFIKNISMILADMEKNKNNLSTTLELVNMYKNLSKIGG